MSYPIPLSALSLNSSGQLVFGAPIATGVVTSITGTANEVIASASSGAITLSLPQPIATTSNVTFGGIGLNGGTIAAGNGIFSLGLELAENGGTPCPLTFQNGLATHFITVRATTGAMASDYTLVLPSAQGAASTFLQNDGSGNLSWAYSSVLSNASLTGQTSAISTTNLFTPPSTGTYRVSFYVVTTAGTVYSLQGTIGWTDDDQAQTATTSMLTNTVGGYTQASFFIEATSGNAVSFSVALTGTATYNVYVVAERLT